MRAPSIFYLQTAALATAAAATLARVRVQITDDALEIRLSPWQKALGLMGNIIVPLGDVRDAQVVEEPVREAMATGMKAGLRLPWLYYVARTIRLDEAFLVRRGVPALSFTVEGGGALRRVLVSTPQAGELAGRLAAR
jgi:hypothetical protein